MPQRWTPSVGTTTRLPLLLSLVKLVAATPLYLASEAVMSTAGHKHEDSNAPEDAPGSSAFWIKLAFSAYLILQGGM